MVQRSPQRRLVRRRRWLTATTAGLVLVVGLDHPVVNADTRMAGDPRGISVQWSGDLFDGMTRSVGGSLHVDVVLETSFGTERLLDPQARVKIERMGSVRRTLAIVPVSIRVEDGRAVHRAEWPPTSDGKRPTPGSYVLTFESDTFGDLTSSNGSVMTRLRQKAVKRTPRVPDRDHDTETPEESDVDVVVIGRRRTEGSVE